MPTLRSLTRSAIPVLNCTRRALRVTPGDCDAFSAFPNQGQSYFLSLYSSLGLTIETFAPSNVGIMYLL
jgi:hypothetical protein